MSRISRRSFFRKTAAGASLWGMSALSYRNCFGADSPSERVRVGMIGVGNQGGPKNNMKHFHPNIEALCDLDQNYLGEAASYMLKQQNRKVTLTDDYRRILDDKSIDAVVITVPDHWHALMTIDACKAGKDVYCEKPLSLVIDEGKAMLDAARKYKRVVQTGSMQRSGEEFKLAIKLINDGLIGKISTVNVGLPGPNWINRAGMPVADSEPPAGFDFNRWLGPAPSRPYNKNRVHYLFRFFFDYSGGQQTNFGAHDLDIAQWGLGMDHSGPVSVEGTATFNPQGWYETPDTTLIKYVYENGVVLNCGQKAKFKGGTEFVGEKGSLHVHRRGLTTNPPELLNGVDLSVIEKSESSRSHVNNFLECVKTRERPVADVEIGHRSATVCHLGNIAIRTGKKLSWDPQKEMFVGDAEIQKWQTKEYRKPWTLS